MAKTIEEYKRELESHRKEYSQLAGQMSAINMYLDELGIEKIKPTHKRVKMLCARHREVFAKLDALVIAVECRDKYGS